MRQNVPVCCCFCLGYTHRNLARWRKGRRRRSQENPGDLEVRLARDVGKSAPKEKLAKMTITFSGDKWTVHDGDTVLQAGTHKFNPDKKPGEVDAKVSEGEGKGSTMLGIYDLKGDTMKVCFDPEGKKPPPASPPRRDNWRPPCNGRRRSNAVARWRSVSVAAAQARAALNHRARFGRARLRSRIRQNAGFRPLPRILANAATAESRTVI